MILGFEILSKPLFSPKILRFKVSNPFTDTPRSLCSLGITKEDISRKFSVFRIFHIFHIYLQATAHVRHLPLRLPPPTSIYRWIFTSNLPHPPPPTGRLEGNLAVDYAVGAIRFHPTSQIENVGRGKFNLFTIGWCPMIDWFISPKTKMIAYIFLALKRFKIENPIPYDCHQDPQVLHRSS